MKYWFQTVLVRFRLMQAQIRSIKDEAGKTTEEYPDSEKAEQYAKTKAAEYWKQGRKFDWLFWQSVSAVIADRAKRKPKQK